MFILLCLLTLNTLKRIPSKLFPFILPNLTVLSQHMELPTVQHNQRKWLSPGIIDAGWPRGAVIFLTDPRCCSIYHLPFVNTYCTMEHQLGSSSKHTSLSKAVLRHGFRGHQCRTDHLHTNKQATRLAAQTQKRRHAIQGRFFHASKGPP
jgi:hypothetical protein